jgi:hypothetical protein
MNRLISYTKTIHGQARKNKIAEIISFLSTEGILSVVKDVLSLSSTGGPHKLVILIVIFL